MRVFIVTIRNIHEKDFHSSFHYLDHCHCNSHGHSDSIACLLCLLLPLKIHMHTPCLMKKNKSSHIIVADE